MSTRAIQDPLQLLGFRDPVTDEWLSGGSVEFYSAGTTNAKTAWEDKDKVTPITSVTLDSSGQALVYFDGVYKFIVKNSSATVKYTLDNLKYQARNTAVITKTTDYQAVVDDDYIMVDTDSAPVTITLAAVAGVVAPITIKNIGTSGNAVTVDGSGSETIDGSASETLLDGASQQYVTDGVSWFGAGVSTGVVFTSTSLIAGTSITFSAGGGTTSVNADAATDAAPGTLEKAIQAEQATGTTVDRAVVTGRQQFHPSAAVAWGVVDVSSGGGLVSGYNVASATWASTGLSDVLFSNGMANDEYAIAVTGGLESLLAGSFAIYDPAFTTVSGFRLRCFEPNSDGTAANNNHVSFVIFGVLA